MESYFVYAATAVTFVWILYKFVHSDSLSERGIPNDRPFPFLGNGFALLFKTETVIDFFEKMYKRYDDEMVFGFTGFLGKYIVVVKDPNLLKLVTVKDFDHFVNRDPFEHTEADKYLSKSLLLMRDQKWKDMRATMSPVFTSSKLKVMFGLLTDCITDFVKFYEAKAKLNKGNVIIETHDVFARITADGIATTTLGFEGDCVRNKDSKIYEIAYNLEDDFTNQSNFLVQHLPKLYKILGLQICRKSVHEFFELNVLTEIKRRQSLKIVRPDVIQLLIQAKQGKLTVEKGDEKEMSYVESKVRKISEWTDDDLVAQALMLFLGGFETTSILMQSLSFELATNQDVQQTLVDEVDEMMASLNGKIISYEQLNSMKFLDMVINEALRKWPSFRITSRECTKDYVLSDTEKGKTYKIKKGTELLLPIGALQNDPKYFPNPEKFDPNRFSDENKSNIVSGSFIPFGFGPRMCIGSRYAILEAKMLLFHILTKFIFCKCAKSPDKLRLAAGLTGFKGKIYIDLKLRN